MCCPLEQPTEDAYNEEYAYTPQLIDEDGNVGVVILPVRHEEEGLPDPFLSSGLRQVVEDYVRERCLINIRPIVRLATFCSIDISLGFDSTAIRTLFLSERMSKHGWSHFGSISRWF